MMKAKDYAKLLEADPSLETVSMVLYKFFNEMLEIADSRKAVSDRAMISIVKEQDQKWKALSRLISWIKPNGFQDFIKFESPELYNRCWKDQRY